ncbi:TetR family transcriptional regulator [Nocardia panacis]|uniref:TetR family transcriptional regulator n=1 Tax=Nocardia panacis TaxID=2340916 RepID=A0A3A4KSL4_9NOCA|nr:TetR/AcrR family transcriptional regulator [Nocardia panacis]RJO79286.1 TetR family transcriptional regulator [Nocardia panacis]
MTAATGVREREKTRVRQELIDTALRLFEDNGFEQTTVQQIADAVRVSRRTFHRHFPSKVAVVFAHEEDLMGLLLTAFDRRPPGESPLTALRAAIREFLLDQSNPDLRRRIDTARRARHLLVTNPQLRQENFIGALGRQHALTRRIVARCGLPETDLRPQLAAACCFAAFGVALDHWMLTATPDIPTLHHILDATIRTLQRGVDF